MTPEELNRLLAELESDRVERKESISDMNRLREAICALANDLPNHAAPGILFIGARDDGGCANLEITDKVLLALTNLRSDGNILPPPHIDVRKQRLGDCDLAVVIVHPSRTPPVSARGRIWVRIGPSTRLATQEEAHRLSEKRRAGDLPDDLTPYPSVGLQELDLDLFHRQYLPSAVAPEILEQNHRSEADQLLSLKFLAPGALPRPTLAGILALGKSPADFIPGAYIQFTRIDGDQWGDPIIDQKEIHGPLIDQLRQIEEVVTVNNRVMADMDSGPTEIKRPDYPEKALRELIRNAVLHRNYLSSNAPVRLSWYSDRIEIQNPGGPFGQVTPENFGKPGLTDYRNPTIAEVMKNLGFVQKFGMGLQLAQRLLKENHNPKPRYEARTNHVLITVWRRA